MVGLFGFPQVSRALQALLHWEGTMPTFNTQVAEFFHDHHGVVSTDELSALEIGDQERRYLIVSGVLVGLFEGVYRLASSPRLTFHGRCRAVCVADASLTLGCFTLGALFKVRRCGTTWIHATTDRGAKPVGPAVKVHRSRLDLSENTVHRADGIRHTDAAQTFFDLAKHVDDLTLRSIGEQIIADGLATYDELAKRTNEIAVKGRPGSGRALRVLDRLGAAPVGLPTRTARSCSSKRCTQPA